MAGLIIGSLGYQRSGKTLLTYLIAESYRNRGLQIYSNMNVNNWHTINSLDEIPFNHTPKVLLLDECYYFLDSRNWSNNTDASIFFNTIGKQNILLLFTAINIDMVEKRLREQCNYIYLCKGSSKAISYKLFDIQRNKSKVFRIDKSKMNWDKVNYNTLEVPNYVDCNLKNFRKKIELSQKNSRLGLG